MKRTFALVLVILGAVWWMHRGSQPPRSSTTPTPEASRPVHTNAPALETPRATDEWQGMTIDDDVQPMCDTSERCGLAAACIAGRCSGCTTDSECASSEACVLDHCVRSELVACRSRTDCKDAERCVLSGISADARGNGDMRAYCQGAEVEIAQTRDAFEANQRARVGIAAPPRDVTPQGLLDSL